MANPHLAGASTQIRCQRCPQNEILCEGRCLTCDGPHLSTPSAARSEEARRATPDAPAAPRAPSAQSPSENRMQSPERKKARSDDHPVPALALATQPENEPPPFSTPREEVLGTAPSSTPAASAPSLPVIEQSASGAAAAPSASGPAASNTATQVHDDVKAAGVVLWTKDGTVLVGWSKRKQEWSEPGGKRNEDESIEDCARRHLHEETGLRADQLQIDWGEAVQVKDCKYVFFQGHLGDHSPTATGKFEKFVAVPLDRPDDGYTYRLKRVVAVLRQATLSRPQGLANFPSGPLTQPAASISSPVRAKSQVSNAQAASEASGSTGEPISEPTPSDSPADAPAAPLKWAMYRMGRKADAFKLPGTVIEGPTGRAGKVTVELLARNKQSFSTKTKFASDQVGDFFEQPSLDAQLAKLKGKARDRSIGSAQVIFDAIDLEQVRRLGSVRASALIELTGSDADGLDADDFHKYPKETVRQRCARDLLRAQRAAENDDAPKSGTKSIGRPIVLYRNDKLSQITGVPGRLVSGVQEIPAENHFHSTLNSLSENMPEYCVTRSIACAPKWYKEFVRPSTVNDFDRKTSFPAVVAKRYPDLEPVREWCADKRACVEKCELELNDGNIKALKEFCNAAAGSGKPVADAFLASTNLSELPTWCKEYRDALREAARRDEEREEGLTAAFNKLGLDKRTLTNKVHYVCNSRDERLELDKSIQAAESVAEIVSLESDGCPCIPLDGEEPTEDWQAAMLGLMDGAAQSTTHVYKPYRSAEELFIELKQKYPDVPESAWTQVDDDWLEIEEKKGQCYKRLCMGERPVLWLKDLVPWHVLPNGRIVKDVYRCIPASKDSMEWWRFEELPKGGMWRQVPPPVVKAQLEEISLDMLCNIRAVSKATAPSDFLEGQITGHIVSRLSLPLYDQTFSHQINGTVSKDYVQFGLGEVLTRQHTIEPGRADLYIGRCANFPYPESEMQKIEEGLAAKGRCLLATLRRVRDFERGLVVGQYVKLPDDIVQELEAIANEPGMEMLKLVHSIFEDWTMTIFRGGKCVAAAIFAEAVEKFVVDLGTSGSNGKTLLQRIAEVSFGDYAEQIKETMMTKDPPPPGSACPDLLQMRGVRYLCTPEVESTQAIKSSWIKKLPDAATKWGARDLYSSLTIHFRLWVTFFISANGKLKFTIVDGGVERRCLACPYDLKFTEAQTEDHHRQIRQEVKEDEWLLPRRPGFWLWVRDIHKAFFVDDSATKLKHVPQKIVDATAEFLAAECSAALREWLDERTKQADSAKNAITKHALLGALKDTSPYKDLKPKELEDTIARTCQIVSPKGFRERVKYELKGGQAVYIKLESEQAASSWAGAASS